MLKNKYFFSTLGNPVDDGEKIKTLTSTGLIFFFFCSVKFSRQMDRDCELLEQERIMDYSLLVGIHFTETSVTGEIIPSKKSPHTLTS